MYDDMNEWFELWFSQTITRRLTSVNGRGLVWCPQWWRHNEVVLRLDSLWRAWEGARMSDDPSAMSGWWIYHADSHLRVLLDSQAGPMFRCSKDEHVKPEALAHQVVCVPPGWTSSGSRSR
ncbi:hypothetical protein GCM10007304_14150 [Rhodococcoides trifolii]|uniref:DUF4913 domain-containing protein n=1 Tax=Rhodococcoides trifolii TaxID=908250 RepID=A0A917FSC6_9NOCA|nr:DUF4913 domain-containing protein [Rhodococcus trifolii]GGG01337.1 hypothetical protein GCM10007304_14150 [Rhodococcus trifolii]